MNKPLIPFSDDPLLKALADILHTRHFQLDEAQHHAVAMLCAFYHRWLHYRQRRGLISWLKRPAVPKGVYLWGGVGRGKSFLMDCFFDAIPEPKKTRWHFHAFMRRIHAMLAQFKQQPDPLMHVATLIAKETRLLCFDEFHISDIADAMILGRLFEYLLKEGLGVVLTSNYSPDALYPNGLQRHSFLPTIELLKTRLEVVHVDGNIDYRHRALRSAVLFYAPLTPSTDDALKECFQRLNGTPSSTPALPLLINDRLIEVQARGEHVIWFDFQALCGTARSQPDYLALAEHFDTLIISTIPAFINEQSPEAIRFKWLIDILYDHRVKLILSATVPIELLCPLDTPNSEFARTLSRLIEMQSDSYLHEAKRPGVDQPHLDNTKDNTSIESLDNTLVSA